MLLPACTTSRPYVAEPYAGWSSHTPPEDDSLAYRIFLVGDAGGASRDPLEPALQLLKHRLAEAAPERTGVVYLGDNIYCCGLPDSSAPGRAVYESRLRAQLDAVDGFEGRVVFIPGNHDWNDGQPGGRAMLRRQQRLIEAARGPGAFAPDAGFPGPVTFELTDRLRLVVLGTQWWFHAFERPFGDTGDYELEEDADFLLELDDVIKRYDDEDLLVVGHHPMFSNGSHSGNLPARDHLFPLRKLHPALSLPLPLVGSLYPLYVRLRGGRQDLAHPRYRALRTALTDIFAQHDHLVYAAGHVHTLEYFPIVANGLTQHYLVSGAGSRPSAVGGGRGAGFTAGRIDGFAEVQYYRDGAIWLTMWGTTDGGTTGTRLFRTRLRGPVPELIDPGLPTTAAGPSYADSSRVAAANPAYTAGPLKTFFLGAHRRDAWALPVTMPVLDLGTEAGGLTPVKRGGGQQTLSLRLQGGDGFEYVLRSIDKDPSKTVPANLQGTVATDIVQDQIASLHPYGAFIIPPLAEAAGVYHTTPKLVYVPDDPRLGIYRERFGDTVMMLEMRPDDDMSAVAGYGGSREVVSANKLYEEITADNDHRVDVRAFARARLFDMWLSDWDRHRDQWRWAAFEPHELDPTLEGDARTEGKVYRPIPRDRDWAFNRMNGVFPSLAARFDPKFQDFTEDYGNLKGLTLNGRPQDRRLLGALGREDWRAIADSLRRALTDAVIDAAVEHWPEAVRTLDAGETARLLKHRRDQLPEVAERFYELAARVVDVPGSDKHERFTVTYRPDGTVEVVVTKTTKEGEPRRELFRRVFHPDETDEVRLYGLDGQDRFVFAGDSGSPITVRAIGGPGLDEFSGDGRGRRIYTYDTEGGASDAGAAGLRSVRSRDPMIHRYDPGAFQYDAVLPLVYFGRTQDDGVFLGGGARIFEHGFRKLPYAAVHTIRADVSTLTGAFNVVYAGHLVEQLGAWDVLLDAAVLGPNSFRNFYGLGNETEDDARDRTFYQARLRQAEAAVGVRRSWSTIASVEVQPFVQATDVGRNPDRLISRPQPGVLDPLGFQLLAGLRTAVRLDTRDHPLNPRRGFLWTGTTMGNAGLKPTSVSFVHLATDLAVYASPSAYAPQLTLAARMGAGHLVGDFPFYSAVTLGARDNLRGFRRTRFAGRTSFYQNLEVRLSLLRFSTYLAMGRLGAFGFLDNGRVWTEADDLRGATQAFLEGYHQGYGGGLWAELFDAVVLTGTAAFSDEGPAFTLEFGFQY